MSCCRNENKEQCTCPNEQVIRGLKAKLLYQGCDLICTPVDRCDCDVVVSDIEAANEWINSLSGTESSCGG